MYVLGEGLKDGAEEVRKVGDFTKILPMRYETVLKRAHARTFNLQRKLEAKQPLQPDAEVEEVLCRRIKIQCLVELINSCIHAHQWPRFHRRIITSLPVKSHLQIT